MLPLIINDNRQTIPMFRSKSSFVWVNGHIYFITKMQLKSQRQSLNSTSNRVLRQLQQNESLRIELFRVRSDLRDQHHHFLNCTLNHEMLLEKVITELTLAAKTAKHTHQRTHNHQIMHSAIEHSLSDLQSILENYGGLRGEWSKSKPQASQLYYQKLLKECSERFDIAQATIEQLSRERECLVEERELKMTQIQFLQGQLGKLKQRYDLSIQQSNALRAENSKLSQAIADCQLKVNNYAEQVTKLNNNNEAISHQLKQSTQAANRHSQYLNNKCRGIQIENKRLIEMQKEGHLKQQQTAAASQRDIDRLNEETHRLRVQVQTFQVKFKEIIDKQNKIRQLQTTKHIKTHRIEPLSQINSQNNSHQSQNNPARKEVGKMVNRKFNLQSFQEKLTNTHSCCSPLPHDHPLI